MGCGEDAVKAYNMGLQGLVCSNHGGRQLDTCRSGIEVLPEVMDALREAGADLDKFKVFIDGGVRRGADIFKAVALGATAVGVGRPVLYSLASYGDKGIVRMVHMLQDELTMVMRLSGTPKVSSITDQHVITRNLADHIVPLPADHLVHSTYMPLHLRPRLFERDAAAASLPRRICTKRQTWAQGPRAEARDCLEYLGEFLA